MGAPFQFAQRFSPYPPVAPPQFEEIAKLKEELHASQMREKDTKIQFLQYPMQECLPHREHIFFCSRSGKRSRY